MVVFCNLVEPNKSMAKKSTLRMRGSSSEETDLCTGGSEPEVRAIALECGCECGCAWGSALEFLPRQEAAVCTAGLCALTPHSCLACD